MSQVQELLSQLDEGFTGERLFDHLADVVFFIKNARAEYVAVNSTLVERCGARDKSQLIGKTASQLYEAPLGARFEAQDQRVLKTGRPLVGQLELHLHRAHDVGWCLTTKLPLMDRGGNVVGLVGVSQDLKLPDSSMEEFQQIAEAVRYAEKNLALPPTVQRLIEITGLSRFQLDRRMKLVFGLTSGQWLLKLRIDSARRRLAEGDDPISMIAIDAGYSDQSAFTRQFRQATGLSPREFRRNRRGHVN